VPPKKTGSAACVAVSDTMRVNRAKRFFML
jgi:hypothetical protein